MVYTTMWSYPWDLADDGIESAVRHLRDELGLDAISVAAAYHTFQQLRPARPGRKLLIETAAALYFRPDPALYEATVVQPRVAPLAQRCNPLAHLRDAAGAAGLDLIAWTVCLHNTYLCQRYPQLAQRTVYGDDLGWALCPGCDDVRTYVVALCRDLATHHGVRRIELESCSFGGYGHAHGHTKDGTSLGTVGRYLYSLSFSAGCCSRARERGIDVEALMVWVRQRLDSVFARGEPLEGSIEAALASHPPLAAFQELREELVASLVEQVRAAVPGVEISFLLMGDRWTAGIHAERLAGHVDRFGVLAYDADPAAVGRRVRAAHRDGVPEGRLVAGLCAYPPASPDAATLKAVARAAVNAGAVELSFYNYGICPPACLEWVRDCIASI